MNPSRQVRLHRNVYWHNKDEIHQWCTEHFGEVDINRAEPRTWSYWSTFGAADFYFAKSEYATLFALRWAS